ncbi:hypothetical protein CLU96_2784 [Chryseobacterium sp. 52]|nr:hypothetical protein CLU96_2784 [Chryseobacterium sp. 52]
MQKGKIQGYKFIFINTLKSMKFNLLYVVFNEKKKQ